MIGRTLGSYRIDGKLGAGGMGVVYSAEHPLIGRKAAIKCLLPEFSNNKDIVERFFNEARAATLVKHAGIVDIFDFGYAEDGSAYIVMEFLEGEGLTDRLERLGRLPDDELVRLSRQVASALAAAHAAGIIHRDLKPDNIHVVPDGEVQGGERIKVLDFGIAKLNQPGGTSKTATGAMMGSPMYMAPEQCRGAGEVDARADVYSLGCVMFHMACGSPPFGGNGVGEVIAKHIYEEPPPPRSVNPSLSPELEAVILCCLAKEPGERFESMTALVGALDGASRGRFSTSNYQPRYRTPPAGVPVVAPTLASQPPTTKDTTLSAAAAVTAPPPTLSDGGSGKAKAWIGVAAAVVVLGGAGVFAMTRGGDDSAPAASTPPPAAAAPVATVDAGLARLAPPDAAAAPEATTVEVAIDSVPSKASIYLPGGIRVGRTPFKKTFERVDGELVYTLRRKGYEDRELVIPLTADYTDAIELEKKGRTSSRSKPKPTRTTATKLPDTKPPAKPDTKPPPKDTTPKWGELED